MAYADADGVRIYFEQAGRGAPIIFVHEFADDLRGWEPQLRYFSRRYRCIAFNARGYPPSDVPASPAKYSQTIATDDIAAVMRHLAISKAHIVGCSMGGYAVLFFGLRYPRKALSLTVVGVGSGSNPVRRDDYLQACAATARRFEREGLASVIKGYRSTANRIQFRHKDPRGFHDFCRRFTEHSPTGHANTMRRVIMRRPVIYSLERQLAHLRVPLHLIVGDEDNDVLEPAVFLKRVCPDARLTVVPTTGHVVNIEEPGYFNRITESFLTLIESASRRSRVT